MKGPSILILLAGITSIAIATSLIAAPTVKNKDADDGPVTEEQKRQSINNLKQIGLAFHNFHDTNGNLPTDIVDKDNKPLLSWRVHLLPYFEELTLYREFKLDEPWDSAHNKKLIQKIPTIYAPVRTKAEKTTTFYQMFSGKSTMLAPHGEKFNFAKITDGLSNTLMVVEAEKPVIWTKPDDIVFDEKKTPKIGGQFKGETYALRGDGSVFKIRKDADETVLRLMIMINDGNAVDSEKIEAKEEKE